jgi:DNA gyrase subunit B
MLENAEIRTMITALGTGIGPEDFDLSKLRYHKVIIMTDADVDGSHIRTLLLTFFFRQMGDLVKDGYLYIAQPPLYRMVDGKKETYIKDETAMRKVLLERACAELVLQIPATEQTLSGQRLVKFMEQISAYLEGLNRLKRRGYPLPALEALLKARVQAKSDFSQERVKELEDMLARQGMVIEGVSEDEEHSLFEVSVSCAGDAKQCANISWSLVSSADYRRLMEVQYALAGSERGPFLLKKNGVMDELKDASALLERLLEAGVKGLHMQRYKGLGEMNPEQLWETTMDPERRTLLQVKVEDEVIADDLFTTLMGDEVEPRRDFIVENALDVRELDI